MMNRVEPSCTRSCEGFNLLLEMQATPDTISIGKKCLVEIHAAGWRERRRVCLLAALFFRTMSA
jgi:hypothetical protein